MTMALTHLCLRVVTPKGLCGVDIPFTEGLFIIRGDNSSGKSTCIQAIIYALGLEGMLSASHEIPLPHVMTELIEVDGEELLVLESEVSLEIKNHKNEYLTIMRTIKGDRDKHLVTAWEGPALSVPNSSYEKQDYFVRERGAATRPLGFHTRLEQFVGWELPEVLRYDGKTSPLYLECIFHLLIVEQKRGWSGFQANLPTQYRIREVDKQAIEFLLGFDTYENVIEKQELLDQIAKTKNEWKSIFNQSTVIAEINNGIVQNLPEEPRSIWPPTVTPKLLVYREPAWISIEQSLSKDQGLLSDLEENEIPLINAALEQNKEELKHYETKLLEKQLGASRLLEDIEVEKFNFIGTKSRVTALEEDLRHNKDVKRLRELGSVMKLNVIHGSCPTCHQQITDSLLLNDIGTVPMTIDENIGFLEEQKKAVNIMLLNSEKVLLVKEKRLVVIRNELDELRARIRNLRNNLVTDERMPSLAALHERIRLKNSVDKNLKAISTFNELLDSLNDISKEWTDLQTKLKGLPSDFLSVQDLNKINALQSLFIEQARNYGLTSINPISLKISQDSYKPTHDGFDLQFDLSASDLVRAIWAFLVSFLEIARTTKTNHLGLLILDEPRQQSAARTSLEELLKRLSASKKYDQQVIFATSEEQDSLKMLLQNVPHTYLNFDGKILRFLENYMEEADFIAEIENDYYITIEDAIDSLIDDVSQISVWTNEINEVLGAKVESLSDFKLENNLQSDREGHFLTNIIVTANLELSDYFAGEIISESLDVDFLVQCSGTIEKNSIKEMIVSLVKQQEE